jgi:hypothetical protein
VKPFHEVARLSAIPQEPNLGGSPTICLLRSTRLPVPKPAWTRKRIRA